MSEVVLLLTCTHKHTCSSIGKWTKNSRIWPLVPVWLSLFEHICGSDFITGNHVWEEGNGADRTSEPSSVCSEISLVQISMANFLFTVCVLLLNFLISSNFPSIVPSADRPCFLFPKASSDSPTCTEAKKRKGMLLYGRRGPSNSPPPMFFFFLQGFLAGLWPPPCKTSCSLRHLTSFSSVQCHVATRKRNTHFFPQHVR